MSHILFRSLWNLPKVSKECLNLNKRKYFWNNKKIYLSKSKLFYIFVIEDREVHTTLDNRVRRINSTRCIKKKHFEVFHCVWAAWVYTVLLTQILLAPVQPQLAPAFLFVLSNVFKDPMALRTHVHSFSTNLVWLGSLSLVVWSWHFFKCFWLWPTIRKTF